MSSQEKTTRAPCWGQRICNRRGWDFNDVFRHQFRIGKSRAIFSWPKCRLGACWIEHSPDLPVTPIRNRRGQKIGWCLGVAVDAAGNVFGGADDTDLTVTASFDAVERKQANMAGRYALLVQIDDAVRYYPDPVSGLTAVTNRREGVIASTVPLAINDELQPSGGLTIAEIKRKPTLYLMGETADARVSQVVGNHFIDLGDFSTHRFWPTEATTFAEHESQTDTIGQMVERLQTIMSGLITTFDCTLPITGGQDSRLLAGAVRPQLAGLVRDVYVHEINNPTKFDVLSARDVAAHLNLPLKVKNILSGACDAEFENVDFGALRAQMALATGYAHPRLDDVVLRALHAAPDNKILLRGGAAEMTRANKWPVPNAMPDTVTADFAFQRLANHDWDTLHALFGEVRVERFWEKYKTWFHALPEAAKTRAPDIGHGEFWLSGSVGAAYYAPRRQFYVNPYNDLTLLHATMRFSPAVRKSGRLVKAMLDRYSPGLDAIPYARQLQIKARAA